MNLPGNSTRQIILKTLVDLFKVDANIRAFIVFGSLVRGNWDNYSDLDLDAIVKDDKKEIIQSKIRGMIQALEASGLEILITFEEFTNESIVIFGSLDRMSIRFHLLEDTNEAILETMKVLTGNLTKDDIKKSTVKKETKDDLELLSNKFLELSLYVPISLRRKKLINALFFLNKMRQTLFQIYVKSRGIPREFDFESSANEVLKKELYLTYTVCEETEIKKAFFKLLDIYKDNIAEISLKKIVLTEKQIALINRVKNY